MMVVNLKTRVKVKQSAKNLLLREALGRIAHSSPMQGIGWFRDQIHPESNAPIPEIASLVSEGGVNGRGVRIPPRPFMKLAIEKNGKKWSAALSRLTRAELRKGRAADMETVLWKVGEIAKEDIVAEIDALTEPPLSPVTIEIRKKRYQSEGKTFNKASLEKPLIDTGAMVGSIQNRRIEI